MTGALNDKGALIQGSVAVFGVLGVQHRQFDRKGLGSFQRAALKERMALAAASDGLVLPDGNRERAAFLFQDDQPVILVIQHARRQQAVGGVQFHDGHPSSGSGKEPHVLNVTQEHAAALGGHGEDGRV